MKIGVVGATGAVGREMLEDLGESALEHCEVLAFATPQSEGEHLTFRGKTVVVKAYNLDAARSCDYILMSAGKDFSLVHSPAICKNGGPTVIDNSSAWRMDPKIPLVVPEVNSGVLDNFKGGIIANPNCAMIQLAVSLKPLRDAFGLELVQVSTYQSVSGTGLKGIKELSQQLSAYFKFETAQPAVYEHPIGFNIIPYIGPLDTNGHCDEEVKLIQELKKVFSDEELNVLATTTRVPVFNCHCEAVTVKLKTPVTRDKAREVLEDFEPIEFFPDSVRLEFPTPRTIVGRKGVFLCRLRVMNGRRSSKWLQFWNVADNLKKGAATNAVQILEYLVENKGFHQTK